MKKSFRVPALCALLAAPCLTAQTAPPPNANIYTFAGDPTGFFGGQGFGGDGGPATSALLFQPYAIAVDSAGNVYLTDTSNQRVRKVNAATGIISTIAGNGTAGYSGDGGPAIDAAFARPSGIAIDAAGNIYVSDWGNKRIRKIDASTGIIETFAGNGNFGYSSVGDGGPATSAQLAFPLGLALDTAGNLYIADNVDNRIRKVDARTHIITTVAGNGVGGDAGDGGPATSAELWEPSGVAVDTSGDIYIADSTNNAIRKVDAATGIITTVAGVDSLGYNGDGIPATSASLWIPTSVILDSAGNFYIDDGDNHRIRKVDIVSGIISTIAGDGGGGWGGDGGPATQASINKSFGIVFDGKGNLLIADTDDNCIRIVGQKPNYGMATTTALAVSANSLPVGQPLTLTATVTAASGATPAGTVTFYNLATPMGGATLDNNGVASLTITPGAGNYSITANYGGSSTDGVSVSSPAQNVTVLGIPTNTSLSASSASLQVGQILNLTSRVTAHSGAIPTGSVTFMSGTTPLGTGTLDANGTAALALTPALGNYSIVAQYAGSSTDAASSSAPAIAVSVAMATTVTTIASSLNPAPFGASVVFTADVKGPKMVATGTSQTPTGEVSFFDGTTLLATASLTAGIGTFSTSGLTVGQHDITASYPATAGFAASTSTTLVEVIQPATFTLSATPATRTVYTGQAAIYTVAVKPGTGFDLSVAFSCTQLPANAACSFSPAAVKGGAWSTTLTVQTDAPHPAPGALAKARSAGALSLAGILVLFFPGLMRHRRTLWRLILIVITAIAAITTLGACSAPANLTGGTPTGMQAITVTGTAGNGSQTVSATTSIDLNVQSLF